MTYDKDKYAKNKAAISAARKIRYANDPVYREAVIARTRAARPVAKPLESPEGYTYTYAEVCKLLQVSVWVVRGWREKSYFPDPYAQDGRLWFTEDQANQLWSLAHFFKANGSRLDDGTKEQLDNLVALTYANW
jgi:hypothetical protein